jgi:hypothetical protein
MDSCDMDNCCDEGGCPGFYYDCICPGESSESCAQQGYPCSVGGCDECTCTNCNDLFQTCQEVPGCSSIFACMRATECSGSGCAQRCGADQSGSDAFAVAEALWACDRGAGCSCDEQGPISVVCGEFECSSYQTNEVTFDACCAGDSGGVEPAAQQVGGFGECGLDLRRYFENAPECMPMNQPNPPPILAILDRCANGRVDEPPYNGATLKGCCRSDGVCGYWDDITGLGCIDSSVFDGVTPPSCN